MAQLKSFWVTLPSWFKTVFIVLGCIIVFKILSSISWILVLIAIALWALTIACVLHRAGRISPYGFLGNILGWLSGATKTGFSSSSSHINSPPPQKKSRSLKKPPKVRVESIKEALENTIIGQNHVCEDIAHALFVGQNQSNRTRPLGVFLFAGPPGTGKTYLAKNLGQILQREVLYLDMSHYKDSGAATSLFGISKGYQGSDSYGALTQGLKDNPHLVVILDEFEKASPAIHTKFLAAFSEGSISESSTMESVSTKDAIFVLTTNAAYEKLVALTKDYKERSEQLLPALRHALDEQNFAKELLDRFDHIMVFSPLEGVDLAKVAILELENYVNSFEMKLAPRGVPYQFLFHLLRRYKTENHTSVRGLIRTIERACGPKLATLKGQGVSTVTLTYNNDILEVRRG